MKKAVKEVTEEQKSKYLTIFGEYPRNLTYEEMEEILIPCNYEAALRRSGVYPLCEKSPEEQGLNYAKYPENIEFKYDCTNCLNDSPGRHSSMFNLCGGCKNYKTKWINVHSMSSGVPSRSIQICERYKSKKC
jgi:hypothetical protein